MDRKLWVLLVVLGACDEPAPEEIITEPLTRESAPPEVSMDVEDEADWVTPGLISGFVADADQAASTVPIRLESAIDGVLYEGNADGDGSWHWQGELTLGENPLRLSAVDREGNESSRTVLLNVRRNAVPDCRIVRPVPGAVVRVGEDVRFTAEVFDADGDPLNVLWRSDLDGALAIGESFLRRLRVAGEHRISLEVRDEIGPPCTDEITILATD